METSNNTKVNCTNPERDNRWLASLGIVSVIFRKAKCLKARMIDAGKQNTIRDKRYPKKSFEKKI
ncbi:MAG: hypothetical protein KBI45_04345 [Candidatus Saccharicenans sp.]|nr:hypothetical protein [Candidatus Saccharicenans sp.]